MGLKTMETLKYDTKYLPQIQGKMKAEHATNDNYNTIVKVFKGCVLESFCIRAALWFRDNGYNIIEG